MQFTMKYGIITYVVCVLCIQTAKRYALRRKVAGGMPGNFRGVCPILNRAIGIMNTVCGIFAVQLAYAPIMPFCAYLLITLGKHKVFRVFLSKRVRNTRKRVMSQIYVPI